MTPDEQPIEVIGLTTGMVKDHLEKSQSGSLAVETIPVTVRSGSHSTLLRIHLEGAEYNGPTLLATAGYVTNITPGWLTERLLAGRFTIIPKDGKFYMTRGDWS